METEFKILWKEEVPVPETRLIDINTFYEEDWAARLEGKTWAWDVETSGLDIKAEVFWIRCISFANDDFAISVELRKEDGDLIDLELERGLYRWLVTQENTLSFNSTYECGVMMRATNTFMKPLADVYILFKALSNEGFLGQRWSLDYGCEHLLGWPVYSDELSKHLKDKGLKKSEMCHVDFEVLGRYNALDSAATWGIYTRCMEAITDHHDTWGKFFMTTHQEDHMALLELQVSAYREGLTIDVEALRSYSRTIEQEMKDKLGLFKSHPKVAAALKIWDDKVLSDYNDLEPKKKYKNNGEVTVNHTKWGINKQKFLDSNQFNINSSDQLRWLAHQLFTINIVGDIAMVKEE